MKEEKSVLSGKKMLKQAINPGNSSARKKKIKIESKQKDSRKNPKCMNPQ